MRATDSLSCRSTSNRCAVSRPPRLGLLVNSSASRCGCEPVQVRHLLGREVLRRDAPDAPAPAAFEVQLLLDVVRQRERCFDHLAVEVEDVDGAVRAEGQVDRAEPVVRRGQELAVVVRSDRGEGGPLLFEQFAVNDVVSRVADEVVAVILLRQKLASVDQWAARGRNVAARNEFRGREPLCVRGCRCAAGWCVRLATARTG